MSRYVTAREVERLADELSPRERAVLMSLQRVRVATGGQLARLHCHDVTARQSRRLLAHLTERRLIARMERSVGGRRAGSSGWVYALDVAGHRLVTPGGGGRKPWTPGRGFLSHSLAVTELLVQLVEAERTGGAEVLEFAVEPACWRSFTGGGGRVTLKPDAFLRLGVGEFEDHYFLELDRGTVSAATLARQATAYVECWRSGSQQQANGVFPEVLFVVPDEARRQVVVDVLAKQPPEAWSLFQVTTSQRAVATLSRGQP